MHDSNAARERFINEIVRRARDEAVHEWIRTVRGEMKGQLAEEVAAFGCRSPEMEGLAEYLVRQVAVSTLYQLFLAVSESEDLRLGVSIHLGPFVDVWDGDEMRPIHWQLLEWLETEEETRHSETLASD